MKYNSTAYAYFFRTHVSTVCGAWMCVGESGQHVKTWEWPATC